MRGIKVAILAAVLSLAWLGTPAKTIAAPKDIPFPDVPRITTEELKSMLGDESVIILDVRMEKQWEMYSASNHGVRCRWISLR